MKAVGGSILQMNIETQSHCQPWRNGKKVDLSQFDNKKPEELQSEFDQFDLD